MSNSDEETSKGTAEPVWSFRGYEMKPAEFSTAMVHYYRAEIQRSNTWRNRLDTTTNWAVVAAGAAISFALTSPQNHFGVIILNMFLVTLFLWIEARRDRYYELWSYRARLMETDFFAAMLVPPFKPHPDWAESLAHSLLQPDFPISMWEAFGRRYRRNYLWIFLLMIVAWFFKSYIHPVSAASWDEVVTRSAIGALPGWAVMTFVLAYNLFLFVIGMFTAGLRESSGEVLPKFSVGAWLGSLFSVTGDDKSVYSKKFWEAWRPSRPRQQLLSFVITGQPQPISDLILKEMRRGVTALQGQGMFTHQDRAVLLVALTATEVALLKELVGQVDPNAFVIVTPAQEVLGRGFSPLIKK